MQLLPILDKLDKTDSEHGTIHMVSAVVYNARIKLDRYAVVEQKKEEPKKKKAVKKEKPAPPAEEKETPVLNFDELPLDDLKVIAKAKGIKGYQSMKKSTLIKRLLNH